MRTLFLLLFSALLTTFSTAQLTLQWEQTYGGEGKDFAHSAIQTPDNGFIIVGSTDSEGSGKLDGYVMKISNQGEMEWSETYGGNKDDEFYAITATNGNYAICGYSDSKGSGGKDFWLILIDGSGPKLWEHFYGGPKDEEAYDIITAFDGSLVMTGYTKSKGAGKHDFWTIQVNPTGVGKEQGKEIWARNVGGNGTDISTKVKQSPVDSFFYVIGHSTSFGQGGMDLYFTRLSPDRGSARGKKYYGDVNFEHGNDFCFRDSTGYLLVGGTMSNSKGYFDGWALMVEMEYYSEWKKSYGGIKEEEFVSVFRDKDDYVLGGFTQSSGEGKSDAWIVKIDEKGNLLNEKTFGEEGDDIVHRMIQTRDGGYLMVGETDSKGEGKNDFWVLMLK